MTYATYYDDAYLTTLEATVTRADAENIELDRTIFYPTGGGQPGDTGVLTSPQGDEIAVVNTLKDRETGAVVHLLEQADNGLKAGDTVNISVDWQRRYCHMRMHTAMHLLGSLIPLPVTSGQVGALKSRLDFDVGEHQLDKAQLTTDINSLIEAGHDLNISSITDAELDANPDLVRTMSVQPPRGAGTIRMIQIQDVDYQPCGGTHVGNTKEVGPVIVSKIENKGKRNRRVHLIFDPASA